MSDAITTLTDEEMVDWANANLDRVRELEAEIERLTADAKFWRDECIEHSRANGRLTEDLKRFASEIERLTADNKLLREKLMEGENLAQEFQYFGMRNEIEEKHPALKNRTDSFIKSAYPLLKKRAATEQENNNG